AAGELDCDPVERQVGRQRRNGAAQKKQPAQRISAPGRCSWPEPSRFFAQVCEDRVRLPKLELAVDQYRHSAAWIEREELGRPLFALGEIERNGFAVEPELVERETNLLRIW